MIRVNKTKKSKYIVNVGWALEMYADNYNDIMFLISQYGREKIQYSKIEK